MKSWDHWAPFGSGVRPPARGEDTYHLQFLARRSRLSPKCLLFGVFFFWGGVISGAVNILRGVQNELESISQGENLTGSGLLLRETTVFAPAVGLVRFMD